MNDLAMRINPLIDLSDLRTAFDLLDRDQDGMVTPTELQFMLRNMGIEMSDELIDGLMKEASKTGMFKWFYWILIEELFVGWMFLEKYLLFCGWNQKLLFRFDNHGYIPLTLSEEL